MFFDVALEQRGESLDTGADVGFTITGRRKLEWLFDPCVKETVLAPGERGEQRSAGAKRQGDVCRRE